MGCWDSVDISNIDGQYDMIFSCPPYHDLEKYSKDMRDLSNMNYDDFIIKYSEIIKNSCSLTYLSMFRHFIPSIEFWDNEQVAEEDYAKINLSKLNLIEHGNYKNPLLAGIAIGLLTQIYEMGGKDYFIP